MGYSSGSLDTTNTITVVSSDEGKIFVDQQPGDTPEEKFDAAVVAQLDSINNGASGRNAVIVPTAARYNFNTPGYTLRHRGMASPTNSKREVHLHWTDTTQGQNLVEIVGGFGHPCKGIWVSAGAPGSVSEATKFRDLTGFYFEDVKNIDVNLIDCQLYGLDTIGCHVPPFNNQSTDQGFLKSMNLRAAMPLVIESGDNMDYINYDLTCGHDPATESLPANQQTSGVTRSDRVWSAIQGGDNTRLDAHRFSGSTQRGNASVYFAATNVTGPGGSILFENHRDEQGYDIGIARMTITTGTASGGHGHTSVTFLEVQTSTVDFVSQNQTQSGYNVQNVLSFNRIGGFLSGGAATGSLSPSTLTSAGIAP